MGAFPEYAIGDVVANKYVIENKLGESPSGRTYLANVNFGSQKIVVKIFHPELSAQFIEAPDFFLKAAAMTEVEQDNLTGTLDIQEEMGLVFLARHFGEGESLAQWAQKARYEGGFYSRGLMALWQSCQGLMTLHDRTKHLNIHPGNVLVGPVSTKLCDWDPRALSSSELTLSTLPYHELYQGFRAPEMNARGSLMTYPSTDLYSIGGLLYFLITGQSPSSNANQNLQAIRGLESDLSSFLIKAMHPKAEERFQEAGAFSDALWGLTDAMQRLEEKKPIQAQRPMDSQPKPAIIPTPTIAPMKSQPTEIFPFPPSQGNALSTSASSGGGANPSFRSATDTDFTMEPQIKSDKDSFFNFFPDPGPTSTGKNTGSDSNIFGSATPVTPPLFPPVEASSESSFFPKPVAPFQPPTSTLKAQKPTAFNQSEPVDPFLTPPNNLPPVRQSKPIQNKPLPVSISSLESDPYDRTRGDSTAGFTQFGFKGAGDNRTGIFNPEAEAAAKRTKLILILSTVGSIVLVVGLIGLFLILRGSFSNKEEAVAPMENPQNGRGNNSLTNENPTDPGNPTADAGQGNEPPKKENVPYPDVQEPAATETPEVKPKPMPDPAPRVAKAPSIPEPSIEKVPEEPPHSPIPEPPQSSLGQTKNPPGPGSDSKISPERQAALMNMVQMRSWPESASERLSAGNDLNDMGKIAEANLAYSKALLATGISEKQKILALGGLAVTFHSMGMDDPAKDAVDKILAINPRNGFALKLKATLK